EQRADVEFAVVEHFADQRADLIRIVETNLTHAAQFDRLEDVLAEVALQGVEPLLADADELDRLALVHQRAGVLASELGNRRIKSAAQAPVGRGNNQQM